MSDNGKKDGFIMQAGILAAASIICRIIGLLYKSPLTAIIGAEGNGYYSTAYNIYTIILLVSSYSIPSAISKVIAQKLALKEFRNAQKIFRCALGYVIIVGGAASLVLFFGAPFLVKGYSVPVLRIFAPTIFFYGLLGVLRGYFQAHKTMMQTSVSQILEQILNAGVSIGAAYLLIQTVSEQDASTQAMYGAVGSALGTGSGVVIALLFMWVIYLLNRKVIYRRIERDKTRYEEPYKDIIKMMAMIVTPFILSTCIYNLTTALNQTIYLNLMVDKKHLDHIGVTTVYGIFSLMVGVSNIPIALSSAMSSAIMPTISSSYAQGAVKQTRTKIASAIKVTMLISIPAAIGIGVLAKPVVLVLYPSLREDVMAPVLLAGLAVTVIFYALSTLTNAVLQGIGRVNTPVIHAVISLAVQTAVLLPILLFTNWETYGLAAAAVVYSFLMCVLNGAALKKHLDFKQEMDKTFARPVFSALVMGAATFGSYQGIAYLLRQVMASWYFVNLIALLLAVTVGGLIYFVLVIKLKAVRESDLKGLPKGRLVIKAAKKIRLM